MVLLAGVAMIVLPGPAVIVIPAGLAILGIEFEWARRCLHNLRAWLAKKGFFPKAGASSPRKLAPAQLMNSAPPRSLP